MQILRAYLRFGTIVLAGCVGVSSCRKPKEAVKSQLESAGYQITPADWFRAASENQTEVLRKFTAGGFDPKTTDAKGNTALHAAATHGAKDAARYLLDKRLDVDTPGETSRTPLMCAVLADQSAMANWLISQGADPKKKDAEGFTPLMLATRENKPRALAEVALHDKEELDAALLVASITGNRDCIDVLTSYGASVYARTDDDRTPLMLAAENGREEAAALLLELGASRFSTDQQGRTAAEIATGAGHPEIAEMITRGSQAIALESDDATGEEMNADLARKPAPVDKETNALDGDDTLAEIRANRAAKPVSLNGAILSETIAVSSATAVGSAGRASEKEHAEQTATLSPLVMRHYRERELPITLTGVSGDTAVFRIVGRTSPETRVETGGMIPGTTLQVIRAHRRMEHSKVSPDSTTEISVVNVCDTGTGATREWTAGRPATARDPVALVEDAATGKRYTAVAGQKFRSGDGTEYTVTDVRPNQIVIEETATGATHTLPLRSTRG